MSDPKTTYDSSLLVLVLTPVISFIFGFLSAVFAEHVRERLFRPILKLSFTGKEDTIAKTKTAVNTEAIYARIKVENTKRKLARSIKAYLVNVEKKTDTGQFAPTIYADSIQLAWACREQGSERSALNLEKGVSQYIDVISTSSITNLYAVHISPLPIRYGEIFSNQTQTLRLTIQVAGDGVDPQQIKLVFAWKGKWDAIDVYEDDSDV